MNRKKYLLQAVLLLCVLPVSLAFPQSRTQRFEKAPVLSSVASSERTGCEAARAVDGKAETWWTPEGQPQGEWILVEFSRAEKISAVEILSFPSGSRNGTGEVFSGLKRGTVELSSGLKIPFDLENSTDPQRITVPETPVRWVKIIVSSCFGIPGADLRVREISVLKVVPIYQL